MKNRNIMAGLLATNYDISNIFLFGNRTMKMTYTNTTGATVALPLGRVMGRILGSQKAWPQAAGATDGSQFPVGVLMDSYSVANGATVTIEVVDAGDVAAEKLIFNASETLDTAVGTTHSIRDGLKRVGIRAITSTELTAYDNAIS